MNTLSKRASILALASTVLLACCLNAQSAPATGALELAARITPTAARPEPVRQFTFYILTKSYADIAKEVESANIVPSREKFIDGLKVSPELKTWLKGHDTLDLMTPDFDRLLTPDDVIQVPEFLLAYQRSNSGGVTKGLPKPTFTEAEKKDQPEKYEKLRAAYLSNLKKFIGANPSTMTGIELELEAVNPQRKWAQLHSDQQRRVQRLAPDVAQTKYLVAKTDTDLDGRASIQGLPAGDYWISSLSLEANAGDRRLRWDVPVSIQPGQTVRIELTNLNALDTHTASAP
jgi:hypothetical protein